jgi:type II secretory pathway pseudopilin PulG
MAEIRRSPFEVLVIVVVVALTVAMGTSLYAGRSRAAKSNLLVSELAMLRSSLITYKLMNHANAPDLKTLMTAQYTVGGAKRPFVESLPFNGEGKVVDPFGTPYAYDVKSGWVASATTGYERW